MARTSSPREQVTSTGIRIVGAAALELAARAVEVGLVPASAGELLWVSRFKARPRIGSGSPLPAMFQALTERLRQEWDASPELSRTTPFQRPAGRFHGGSWSVRGEGGAWKGELLWRHRHPVLAATPILTHILFEEYQHQTLVTVGVSADGGRSGVRGFVGAGQSRSGFLDVLRDAVHLTSDGFGPDPVTLADQEVTDFVGDVLLSDDRTWPVAVLAPTESDDFLVPPAALTHELFGLAPVYLIDRHASTFRLTDAIGNRRLSAYWGALRVYRPTFSCADRSDDHWLLLRDRVEDPLERTALVGKVGAFSVERHGAMASIDLPAPVAPPVLAAQAADAEHLPAATGERTEAPVTAAALESVSQGIEALGTLLRDVSGTIAHLAAANAELVEELARLRTATVIRASGTGAIERRLAAIEAHLRPEADPADAPAAEREGDAAEDEALTLVDVVRHAGSEFSDALLVLESAERTALDSPYEDPERLAAILQGMAYVARRRQEGGLETGLRAAFQELGIDYRPGISRSSSERLRRQHRFRDHEGREYDCFEHIAVGATYDPRRCLRIYFTSRAAAEPRFVIGHAGRHLEVQSST